MGTSDHSLREAMTKWLMPNCATPFRIRAFRLKICRRCVAVDAQTISQTVTIFFFQHEDKTWNVIPPRPNGPTMRVCDASARSQYAT